MPIRTKCSRCGKKTRYQDGICQSCRTAPATPVAPVTPTTTPVVVNKKNGGKKKMKTLKFIGYILGCVLLVVLIIIAGMYMFSGCNRNVVSETTPATTVPAATTTPTETTAVPAETTTIPVVDPALEHGTYPQTQIGHPNFYVETGTDAIYKWTFEVKNEEIGIVGGLVVDGQNGGVLRAYAPGTYTVEVQNGFVLTTQANWAQNEFEFRLGQTIKYDWAHGTVDYGPLTVPTSITPTPAQ